MDSYRASLARRLRNHKMAAPAQARVPNGPPSPTSVELEVHAQLVSGHRASGDDQSSARFEEGPAQCGKLTWWSGTAAQNRIECRSKPRLCAEGLIGSQRDHPGVPQSKLSDDHSQKGRPPAPRFEKADGEILAGDRERDTWNARPGTEIEDSRRARWKKLAEEQRIHNNVVYNPSPI
jgi:hypothetical protein